MSPLNAEIVEKSEQVESRQVKFADIPNRSFPCLDFQKGKWVNFGGKNIVDYTVEKVSKMRPGDNELVLDMGPNYYRHGMTVKCLQGQTSNANIYQSVTKEAELLTTGSTENGARGIAGLIIAPFDFLRRVKDKYQDQGASQETSLSSGYIVLTKDRPEDVVRKNPYFYNDFDIISLDVEPRADKYLPKIIGTFLPKSPTMGNLGRILNSDVPVLFISH